MDFHECYRFLHVFMRIVWTQSHFYERNSCEFTIVKTLWDSPVAENQGVVMETINSQDLFFISASLFREYFLWMAPQCMLNCLHNFILFKCFYTMARCSTFTLYVSYFEQSVLEKASGLLIRLRKTWPQNHVKQFSRWSLLLTSVTAFDVPYLSARTLRINLVSWHWVQLHCIWGGKHVLSSYPEISVLCSLEAVAKSTVFVIFLSEVYASIDYTCIGKMDHVLQSPILCYWWRSFGCESCHQESLTSRYLVGTFSWRSSKSSLLMNQRISSIKVLWTQGMPLVYFHNFC